MRVRTHTNPFQYRYEVEPLELADITSHYQDLDLEIGFGRGAFLRNWAINQPNRFIIGAEIRKQMVDILQDRVNKQELKNTLLFHGSGEQLLEFGLPEKSIARIYVFHPDPWFKKRHHKRRVINSDSLKKMTKVLKPKGRLYISTDVQELWEAMRETICNSNLFQEIDDNDFWETQYTTHWEAFSERDSRPQMMSTFEKSNPKLY
ncbi:tRNA (guanosine(46)-N7)-methyltransferase TrmB [Candidatus Marinamargulisbacteria bacterium SCGC AG-410-N11]|nr:tRNA (guanosine(46)-N7)-methyltransferase TrmB [Candidatus Marinamargulisbacteria bacterium SCGC AG-410-N11]